MRLTATAGTHHLRPDVPHDFGRCWFVHWQAREAEKRKKQEEEEAAKKAFNYVKPVSSESGQRGGAGSAGRRAVGSAGGRAVFLIRVTWS